MTPRGRFVTLRTGAQETMRDVLVYSVNFSGYAEAVSNRESEGTVAS